ncbi:hypothetical protein LZC95_13405 [Pendulispora brunnea]|uniref:Outer membrane protein beta-barrel domain-containing protein n=1 Tax=Pendulispora brunnea TaxID=2905690 RepID=A0ABZ2KGX6_9BACT
MTWLFSSLLVALAQDPGERAAPVARDDVQLVNEAAPGKKRWSPVRLAVGAYGVSPNMKGFAFGFDASLRYHMRHFAIGGGGRSAFPSSDASEAQFTSLYFGPRYYPFPGSMSPLLGAGLGWSWLARRDVATETGPSAYVELGIEVFRKDRFRVAAISRLDLPFYTVSNRYDTPVSLGFTVSF